MEEVIIVGPDHHNTLGIVRSLGEEGIKPIVIIYTNGAKSSFVLKSKYVKEGYMFEDPDAHIIDFIIKRWSSESFPPVLIGSSDIACALIDANLSKLQGFIFASCNSKENGITALMDKYTMNQQAEACGFDVPNSTILKKGERLNVEDICLPCIVKPLESSNGNKSDIAICATRGELLAALSVFEKQRIDILVQDFLKADYEIGIMGCSFYSSGEVWIPDVIFKKRFSNKSAVFAEVEPIQNYPDLTRVVETIKTLVTTIGYRGIFDVDLLYSSGRFFFIEMNMRNGAYGYGLSKSGANLAYDWVMDALGHPVSLRPLAHSAKIMCEFSDFRKRKENKISFKQWYSDYRDSSHMIIQLVDLKPSIAFIINKLRY